MGNGGWYGSAEEWNRIEAPLKQLDAELDRFARKHALVVTRNAKDRPERSLAWGTEVRCLIQVFLTDQSKLALNVWICASLDRDGNRFWKKETPREGVQASEIVSELFDLLEDSKRKLEEWRAHPELLEFATKLVQ